MKAQPKYGRKRQNRYWTISLISTFVSLVALVSLAGAQDFPMGGGGQGGGGFSGMGGGGMGGPNPEMMLRPLKSYLNQLRVLAKKASSVSQSLANAIAEECVNPLQDDIGALSQMDFEGPPNLDDLQGDPQGCIDGVSVVDNTGITFPKKQKLFTNIKNKVLDIAGKLKKTVDQMVELSQQGQQMMDEGLQSGLETAKSMMAKNKERFAKERDSMKENMDKMMNFSDQGNQNGPGGGPDQGNGNNRGSQGFGGGGFGPMGGMGGPGGMHFGGGPMGGFGGGGMSGPMMMGGMGGGQMFGRGPGGPGGSGPSNNFGGSGGDQNNRGGFGSGGPGGGFNFGQNFGGFGNFGGPGGEQGGSPGQFPRGMFGQSGGFPGQSGPGGPTGPGGHPSPGECMEIAKSGGDLSSCSYGSPSVTQPPVDQIMPVGSNVGAPPTSPAPTPLTPAATAPTGSLLETLRSFLTAMLISSF